MSRIALTGGSGFLGLHLTRALRDQGDDVVALVRQQSRTEGLEALGATVCRVDLLQASTMQQSLQGVSAVIHAAGGGRRADRGELKRANTDTTVALATAMIEAAPQARFVFVSSAAAHGPAPENAAALAQDADHPTSQYGQSKLDAELWLKEQQDVVHSVILRPPAVYGPGDDRMVGLFKAAVRGFALQLGGGTLSMISAMDLVHYIQRSLDAPVPSGTTLFVEDGEVYDAPRLGLAAAAALGREVRPLTVPTGLLKAVGAVGGAWGRISGKNVLLNSDKVKDLLQASWQVDGSLARRLLGYTATDTFEQQAPVMLEDFRARGLLSGAPGR